MDNQDDLQKLTIPRTKGIELCADLLFKGQSRQTIVQELTTTYKVSEGGVDKWIKAARSIAEQRQQNAERIRAKVMDVEITKAVEDGLLSDTALELILSKIAAAGYQVEEWIKGELIIRGITPTEQIQAIRTLYQKRGSNAPVKMANTNKDGDDIIPMQITLLLGPK